MRQSNRKPMRPELTAAQTQGVPKEMLEMMQTCWRQDPEKRPPITVIKDQLERMNDAGA